MNAPMNTQPSLVNKRIEEIKAKQEETRLNDKTFKNSLIGNSNGLSSIIGVGALKDLAQINQEFEVNQKFAIGGRVVSPASSSFLIIPSLYATFYGFLPTVDYFSASVAGGLATAITMGLLLSGEYFKGDSLRDAVDILVQNDAFKKGDKNKRSNPSIYVVIFILGVFLSLNIFGTITSYTTQIERIDSQKIKTKVVNSVEYQEYQKLKTANKNETNEIAKLMSLGDAGKADRLVLDAIEDEKSSILNSTIIFLLVTIIAEFFTFFPYVTRYSALKKAPLKTRKNLLKVMERNTNLFVKAQSEIAKAKQDRAVKKMRDKYNLDGNLISDVTDLKEIVTKMFENGKRSPDNIGKMSKLVGIGKLTQNGTKAMAVTSLVQGTLISTGLFYRDSSKMYYLPKYTMEDTISYLEEKGAI